MYLTTERPPGYSLMMPTGVGEQISEQSEGFDEQQEGKLDPRLSVELVDPVTTSSTSSYPLQLLDDSVAKKKSLYFWKY